MKSGGARPPSAGLSRLTALGVAGLFLFPLAAVAGAQATPPSGHAAAPLSVLTASQFAGTQYLIVTGFPYASAMQSIADWKTQKGLPAKVALIEDIKASYAGRDDAEKLHTFLQDVYFNGTARGLKYVLLGGGVGIIPIRYLRTNGSEITNYTHDDVFSDVYYAGLDGNWDSNGNGVFGEYGEEDWNANVYVGRLPFNNTAQAAVARDNLLSYERAPFVGAWMKSAVAFASVFDPPNDPATYDATKDNGLAAIQLTQPYLPPGMSLSLLADYYQFPVGNYTPALDQLSQASEVAAISAGRSVVISVTHGWVPSGKGTPEYDGLDGVSYSWGEGLNYHNASDFTNFGELSFGYFSSCLIGNFSNSDLPNFGRFVVQDNHGFVAEVVPTDGTLRGENDGSAPGLSVGNWWQSENFWKEFFTGADPYRPGPALYQGIRDYAKHIQDVAPGTDASGRYRTQKAVYNLLGDPEVPIWTDVALFFNASTPAQVYTAEEHFRATLRDTLGRPAAGATVALSGAGVYATATADSQGRVDVVITPTSTGSLTFTATLHNFIPYQASIPVQPAPPDLSIERADVSLSAPVPRTGEAVALNFTVRNLGQLAAGATDVRVYDTPPSGVVQLVGTPLALPSLSPGESASYSVAWAPAEDGLHALRIVVDQTNSVAEFDELNNEVTLQVESSSVDLSLSGVAINPPGQVAPGGVIAAAGRVDHVGLVPRGYLVGFDLLRSDGSSAASGNVVASAGLTAFSFDVPVPEAGNFTLRIRADSAEEIVEFNESNNDVFFAVRAGAGPSIFALPPVRLDEDAPVTAAISDLRGFVSDPDTPFGELSLAASSSAPNLSVWVDGPALFALPEPNWWGNGTIVLTVTDGRDEAQATVAFTVVPHPDAPVIERPGLLVAVVGEPFVYQFVARDADGDPLRFSYLESGSGNFSKLPGDASGLVAFVPTADLVGQWVFGVQVDDGTGLSAAAAVTLVVAPANHAPTLVDLGPFEVVVGTGANFTLAALDPDGDPVTFSTDSTRATVTPGGELLLSQAQVAALAQGGASLPVAVRIPVTVSDGLGESQGNVTVVVRAPPAHAAATYGDELAPYLTMVVVVACAVAGAALTLGRARRRR